MATNPQQDRDDYERRAAELREEVRQKGIDQALRDAQRARTEKLAEENARRERESTERAERHREW